MVKVGLIGCGSIGLVIAGAIDSGRITGRLVSVYDVNVKKAEQLASKLKNKPKIAKSFRDLLAGTDIIVEAASQKAVKDYALTAISAKKSVLIMSAGALLNKKLLDRMILAASKNNTRIYIPSGAIAGTDGVKSASAGRIKNVLLQTTKPPRAISGFEKVKRRKVVFDGPASKAVELFPANVNVSAVLSLVGLGSEKTRVRIIADPKVKGNIHEIFVSGTSGKLYSRVDNVPSPSNPRTSYLACLSAVKTLGDIDSPVKIGT